MNKKFNTYSCILFTLVVWLSLVKFAALFSLVLKRYELWTRGMGCRFSCWSTLQMLLDPRLEEALLFDVHLVIVIVIIATAAATPMIEKGLESLAQYLHDLFSLEWESTQREFPVHWSKNPCRKTSNLKIEFIWIFLHNGHQCPLVKSDGEVNWDVLT